jgi:Ala-tRNA(Pro) deacylase
MSVARKLKAYLDGEKVNYEVLSHSESITALETAESLHVPGKQLAKVIMVKVGEGMVMTVLPSNWKVDLNQLKDVFRTSHVQLATEEEFQALFPDCEVGGMPPFGNLYGLDVHVDRSLTEDEEIVFHAGTHHEAIKMRYEDFANLVKPAVEDFHLPISKISE